MTQSVFHFITIGVIYVAEDTAILDASIDTVTSRNVRDKIKAGESVTHIVGEKINEYVNINRIGFKVSGSVLNIA